MKNRLVKILMLLLLCFVLTTILQHWVGGQTIYNQNNREARLFTHKAIFNNELPEGEHWKDYGLSGTNVRIFAVYLVEYMHRISKTSIYHLYKALDYLSLFLCFIGLFIYLSKWLNDQYCLIGILYTSIVFVMTYYLHYFHPWDRVSLLSWIILIYLIREKKNILFAILLAISVIIKYDVKILPLLYFFYNYSKSHRLRIILNTIILFSIAFGMHKLLKIMLPAQEQGLISLQGAIPFIYNKINKIKINYWHCLTHKYAYPPLLMFILPCILALLNLRKKEKFIKSSVLFSFILFIPHLILTNFQEVRAQTMILVLLLPSALLSLKKILES